jgi:ABC-2 type transport system ATP-binding protein
MNIAINCRGLQKRFPGPSGPVDAVRGIDLEVRRGECFGLLGPNGAGKTTTVEILEGIQTPTSGEVRILGQPWGVHDAALRQRLGISLQETRFEEKLTVRETLTLFRSFYERGRAAEEMLEVVGLTAKADAYVGLLSGGQRQRLALACALAGDPELVFLDEPTTGLDAHSRRQLWDVLRRFRAAGGAILLTTHAMDEAEQLCDRLAIIDQGRIIAVGTPADLIAQAGGEHVIEFAVREQALLDEDALQRLPGVVRVGRRPDGYRLDVTSAHLALPALLRHLHESRVTPARLTTRQSSLEEVFLTLTGRHWPADGANS